MLPLLLLLSLLCPLFLEQYFPSFVQVAFRVSVLILRSICNKPPLQALMTGPSDNVMVARTPPQVLEGVSRPLPHVNPLFTGALRRVLVVGGGLDPPPC